MGKFPIHRVDANAEELYAYARELGMSVKVIHTPLDALFGVFGLTVVVEVKTEKGAVESRQLKFMHEFKGKTACVRNREHVYELYRELKAQARAIRAAI